MRNENGPISLRFAKHTDRAGSVFQIQESAWPVPLGALYTPNDPATDFGSTPTLSAKTSLAHNRQPNTFVLQAVNGVLLTGLDELIPGVLIEATRLH